MATYYFRGSTGSTSWNTASNWSLTSGGGATGAVPTIADDVILDANSVNASGLIDIATTDGVCASLNCTGYTGAVLNLNGATRILTVRGNITLGGVGMAITGTTGSILRVDATSTITANGSGIYPIFQFYNRIGINNTYTISGLLDVSTIYTTAQAGALTHTINGSTVTCNSLTINNGAGSSTSLVTGTSKFVIGGGSIVNSNGSMRNNIDINGNLNLPTTFNYNTGTIRYLSGTVQVISSPFICSINMSANTTFDWNGSTTYLPICFKPAATITVTLTTDAYVRPTSGTTGVGIDNNQVFTLNGNSLYTYGITNTSILQGTTNIYLTGNTWSGSGNIFNNITFQSGTVTVSGIVSKSGGTITYTAGTVTTTGSTLQIVSSATINTAGMTWDVVVPMTATPSTLTLSSVLSALTFRSSLTTLTIAGASGGITCNNFAYTGVTLTLTSGTTYTINTSLTLNSAVVNVLASIATSPVTFTLSATATSQIVGNVVATDINSSGGQTIWDFNGTLTRTTNWMVLNASNLQTFSPFIL